MEFLFSALDTFLHLERHLDVWATNYGFWMYTILFAIIFAETGLVVTPFLPGDSLLFAIGAIAARGVLSLPVLLISLAIAAILGDTVNYFVGKYFGDHVLRKFSRIVKPAHIEKTHTFYEKYGAKTIVIARFVPIVRTLAPFVAGIAAMHYATFSRYNVLGALLWILSLTLAGYFFGNFAIVKNNFSLVIVGIVILSLVPMLVEILRSRLQRNSKI